MVFEGAAKSSAVGHSIGTSVNLGQKHVFLVVLLFCWCFILSRPSYLSVSGETAR